MKMEPLYNDMRLYITPDRFFIEPQGTEDEFITIDRCTGDVTLTISSGEEQLLMHSYDFRNICGVLGMIRLPGGLYLVVVTHRIHVGLIDGNVIWQLAGFDMIPLQPTLSLLGEERKEQNSAYLAMIRQVLDTPYFYFSYSYNLSNKLQRMLTPNYDEGGDDLKFEGVLDLVHNADKRFVWNMSLLEDFYSPEICRYALPIIHGFVSINNVVINSQELSWILISRRSIQHAGTRLFCRGIDNKGNVANYVETEQILLMENDKVSFVQTRGSIPLYWQQAPNLKYKPSPQLLTGRNHLIACSRHFDDQCQRYGAQVLINLIDHKGPEDVLEKAYDATVSTLGNALLSYVSFDFHQECKNMRYDRLSTLIWRIAKDQDNFGVFHVSNNGIQYSSQKGVFRTNCIDCLDRTNVVQSMIARRSLEQTLQKLGIFRPGQKRIDPDSHFATIFKSVWADNADLISLQYSGTGALKTDFTRTGKRTLRGMLQDGINSLTRYVKNNFTDGFRQDSIDLFLGNYKVHEGEEIPSPLKVNASIDQRKRMVMASVLFEIALFSIIVLTPNDYNFVAGGLLLAWAIMVGCTCRYISRHRNEFVDWPKLIPKEKLI